MITTSLSSKNNGKMDLEIGLLSQGKHLSVRRQFLVNSSYKPVYFLLWDAHGFVGFDTPVPVYHWLCHYGCIYCN